MTTVTEIVSGIYRISSGPAKDYPIGFNQFLIADEKPTLIHTGIMKRMTKYDPLSSRC